MIDVIVPVYRGFAQTRSCLESVLGNGQTAPMEVVVIDDASPEAAITTYLDELAAAGRVILLRNTDNRGFVQSVNRGMSLHPDRDVVLLNSDTEVANDWLDRLRATAYRAADIGTVTPFSNNATICSYPFEGWDGGLPGSLGLAALDRLFAATHRGLSVDLPTGVGFCMFIRRDCLQQIGLFDVERFGRGYGEENDFCMRAAKVGWRHVLAASVFVFHQGAVSFADERTTLVSIATEALLDAHPDYLRRVREFIGANPLDELRCAIDAARAAQSNDEARHVVAERGEEVRRLSRRLWDTEAFAFANQRLAQERDIQIGKLDEALANVTGIVRERDQTILALRDEISKLYAGLQYAESLAFKRLENLDRIHAAWFWRYVRRFVPENE